VAYTPSVDPLLTAPQANTRPHNSPFGMALLTRPTLILPHHNLNDSLHVQRRRSCPTVAEQHVSASDPSSPPSPARFVRTTSAPALEGLLGARGGAPDGVTTRTARECSLDELRGSPRPNVDHLAKAVARGRLVAHRGRSRTCNAAPEPGSLGLKAESEGLRQGCASTAAAPAPAANASSPSSSSSLSSSLLCSNRAHANAQPPWDLDDLTVATCERNNVTYRGRSLRRSAATKAESMALMVESERLYQERLLRLCRYPSSSSIFTAFIA
jgi:hypothetical protein